MDHGSSNHTPGQSTGLANGTGTLTSSAALRAGDASLDQTTQNRSRSMQGESQNQEAISSSENNASMGAESQGRSSSDNPQTSSATRASTNVNRQAEQKSSRQPNIPAQTRRKRGASYAKVGDFGIHKMHRFSLYETQTRYYVVGGDLPDANFRMLKIDRTAPPGQLSIVEDEIIYSKREMSQLLETIDDGNRAVGGMKMRYNASGLLGFIRFTESYYMLLVTKKAIVAMIGGHFIYQIDATELIPLSTGSSSQFRSNRNAEETRFLTILNNLGLHRSFYFSYNYNITRTLQQNIIAERNGSNRSGSLTQDDFNDMFVWNHHLLTPALEALKNPYDWCMPIIHGFIDQSSLNVFGSCVYVTLVARRSRFFAGARFLKRGSNDLGYVANDVETEQIVANMVVTSFNAPGPQMLQNPNYTSFVQHRGSIPLYWTQENTGVSPKPAIDLNLIDPFYAAAGLHFDNLFERYGAPICVLNLIKARERTPRESKLLVEYQNAINYLNQSLPESQKIIYRAYDMSRAAKTHGQDVIGTLEKIAEGLVTTTGFFHNGTSLDGPSTQNGVIRSNCIDCLDRTNAAQFVIGKLAFGAQLKALGILADDSLNYDSDATNLFAHMYNDHGDTLASQYGGSHLVNTTNSYRKIKNWQSNSRDMLESFKRYYHNSFFDNQRQEAYNLFLGNYIFAQGQPMLWELPNDYYLHHTKPALRSKHKRRDYFHWYTPEYLEQRTLPTTSHQDTDAENGDSSTFKQSFSGSAADWWFEYYRPSHMASFTKLFTYHINSTRRYLPKSRALGFDQSPFSVRKTWASQNDETTTPKSPNIKPNLPADDSSINEAAIRDKFSPLSASTVPHNPAKRISSLQKWLHPSPENSTEANKSISPPHIRFDTLPPFLDHHNHNHDHNNHSQPSLSSTQFTPADKSLQNTWTLNQFHANSLNPTVTSAEASEYERYISHPLHIPLITNNAPTTTPSDLHLDPTSNLGDSHRHPQRQTDLSTNSANYASFTRYLSIPQTQQEETINSIYSQDDIDEWKTWLRGAEEITLGVTKEDGERKRYQAYRKWLKGKSLFKQSKVDPEFADQQQQQQQQHHRQRSSGRL